ncbi:MAG: ribonuclease [Chitinophagaceae bacterium]|jgi:hypothetical protein|nr:ribonuclease [Chitinophagaceae bacterium]
MNPYNKKVGALVALTIILLGYFYFKNKPKNVTITVPQVNINSARRQPPEQSNDIEQLTQATVVVAYIKQHNKLPDCYITKREAMNDGWNPSAGNLCNVLPGKAIGGDIFSNRERRLPYQKGRIWYEADVNFSCGHRNADRLIFSSDGLIFITTDHYQTFSQQ